jgi:hypothetical protein
MARSRRPSSPSVVIARTPVGVTHVKSSELNSGNAKSMNTAVDENESNQEQGQVNQPTGVLVEADGRSLFKAIETSKLPDIANLVDQFNAARSSNPTGSLLSFLNCVLLVFLDI